MTKHEARSRGLRLAAKITGIGGIALAAVALAEARTSAATTPEPRGEATMHESATHESATHESATHESVGESALKGQASLLGGCGCAPCWGPPAPPPRGVAS